MGPKAAFPKITTAVFCIVIVLAVMSEVPRPTASVVLAGLGLIAALFAWLIATGREGRGAARRHGVPLVLVVAGAAIALVPEVVRRETGASNAGWLPPVFGPGDTSRHEFDAEIRGLDGKWTGSGRATLTVDGRDEPVVLRTRSRKKDWRKRVRLGRQLGPATPWVEVQIPDDPGLAHASGRIDLTLRVIYPAAEGDTFRNAEISLHLEDTLVLSAVGAGERYAWWWVGASLLAGVTVIGGLWWLDWRSRQIANAGAPHEIARAASEP